MAKIAKVSSFTIRQWIKRHDITWRTNSESLLLQSAAISARAQSTWADQTKRQKHSLTMKAVQENRKAELSASAKENWRLNRDKITAGIRTAAQRPTTKAKRSAAAQTNWSNPAYRQKISDAMAILWQDDDYRNLVIQGNKDNADPDAIRQRWLDPQYRAQMVAAIRHNANNPEYLTKLAESSRLLWENPEYRAKQNAAKTDEHLRLLSKIAKRQWQNPEYRAKLATGITTAAFLAACIERHGDVFNYDSTRFGTWQDRIDVVCTRCGTTLNKIPQCHIKNGYCQVCHMSAGQRTLSAFLDDKVTYITNDRQTIPPLELDIYIPSHKLAIEYHGLYWHSSNQQEAGQERLRHQTKALRCKEAGIKLLQFFDFELEQKPTLVYSMIDNAIGLSEPLNARSMGVKRLDNADAERFFSANHLHGHRTAATTIALHNNAGPVMAISASRQGVGYEIIRMATLAGLTVRGGAGRLLVALHKAIDGAPLTTYADLRISQGGVYDKLGFTAAGFTAPGYFYYRGNTILSRQKCQKHKLAKLLGAGFNPAASESANMFANGFRRVWDAGHLRFSRERSVLN